VLSNNNGDHIGRDNSPLRFKSDFTPAKLNPS